MTTLLKGRNLSHFLLQVPGISQSPGRPRFIFHVAGHFELCFFYSISDSFAQSEPFLRSIIFIFLKYGPPSGGKNDCYVTPDLSYD